MWRRPTLIRACLTAIAVAAPLPSEAQAPAIPAPDLSWTIVSPSGAVSARFILAGGELRYSVSRGGTLVVQDSDLGIVRSDTAFDSGLTLVSVSEPIAIDEEYSLPHGKSSQLRNHASERTLEVQNPSGKRLQVIFRAYDDGVAFRYRFPEVSWDIHTVTDELTAFTIAADGRAVLQPYEPESVHEIVPTEDPPSGVGGWSLPALFDLGHSWAMLAESDLEESYFAAQIDAGSRVREYRIKVPTNGYGDREPGWQLPWEMPWRAILVGPDPGTIIASDLVAHLADPCRIADTSWIVPGRVSWHWWTGAWVGSMNVLKSYVDLAQSMGWEYSLVDADWDDYHSDTAMQALVEYAAARDVGIFLWYNSAGPQNNYEFSPRDRMWDPEIRREEMDKLVSWGVKGIKVDFFNSEKQVMILRYLGILEDAAARGLLVGFHGSTPPRGWYRTWPNMMTTEAVKGAEYYRMDPEFPAEAPLHNVKLVFTRNVVGPMDYTPVTFSDKEYPHITTNAHELALSVAFESGLLHLADNIASYQGQPEVVRNFLGGVPAAWDEIRFVEGDPASHVVLARRKGAIWYLAGLNGTGSPLDVAVDLAAFDYPGSGGTRIGDGETPRTFSSAPVVGTLFEVTMSAWGGFVAYLPSAASGVTDRPIDRTDTARSGGAVSTLDLILPNPFAAATRILYTIPDDRARLLSIHDAKGRRIRTLRDGSQRPGSYAIDWDGRDDGGAAVAAGLYFCRLSDGEQTARKRILRLR